jgi:multidrug efflux pump subunit AcrB
MADNQEQATRSFGLTNLALRNRISIYILAILLAVMGVYSYTTMPKEAFPEIVIPTVYVGTPYPGNSPADIENLVTRPIEKEIQGIDGIKEIRSTSQQDFSSIIVEFNTGVDISAGLQDVKDAVDEAEGELPGDLPEEPNVRELDFSDMPIMTVNLSGDYPQRELKSYTENLQDEIEEINEISQANITGDLERQINIKANLPKMEAAGVTFRDIENAVSSENVSVSTGEIKNRGFNRSMRIIAEFEEVSSINNVIIKEHDGKTIHLRDVAQVQDGFEERKSFSRANRLPVISLQVIKRSGENLLAASRKIKEVVNEVEQNRFPDGLDITITNDNSRYTKNQVSNLENSIISGVILVTLTLLFFMGLRNALFVGLAIPLSMFIAFLALDSSGVTLNLVVLFSLILALGLLVDNGIVVVENIYRLMQEGQSSLQAARQGAGEVAIPIIASTATTLAAFFPLVFWQGTVGEFMKYLPITLIIVLASSLFVALVINPVITSGFMRANADTEKPSRGRFSIYSGVLIALSVLLYLVKGSIGGVSLNFLGGLLLVFALITLLNVFLLTPSSQWFQQRFLPVLEQRYEKVLNYAIRGRKPYGFFLGTVALLIGSIALFVSQAPKVLFFPENQPDNIFVYTENPVGSSVRTTDSVTKRVSKAVYEVLEPYDEIVESVKTNVGKGAQNPQESFRGGGQATPNRSRITVAFVEFSERNGINTSEILEKIRTAVSGIPGPKITVEKNSMGPPVGKPISIEVSGQDINKLISVTNRMQQRIQTSNIKGIEDLQSDLVTQKPQLVVDVDRSKAQRLGFSTQRVASELRTALFGKEIDQFQAGEDEYEIRLKLADEFRYNVSALLNHTISVRRGGSVQQVPISAVADVDYGTTYGSIERKDLDRVITLSSNVKEDYNANAINDQIKELLQDFKMPSGYQYKFAGEQEEQAESSSFLLRAMLIAVFTILLILVSQFNSLLKPVIIIISVLFSTIGVFLGLVVFNLQFVVVMTGIGIISLAGIVVNNAIVLIDYIDLTRERRRQELGLAAHESLPLPDYREAVVYGGKVRLRPVLLTALTTVLGLIPLAIGLNIDFYGLLASFSPDIYWGGNNALFWGPMAYTVIMGLIFATFLTLVIVPVMYVVVQRLLELVSDTPR